MTPGSPEGGPGVAIAPALTGVGGTLWEAGAMEFIWRSWSDGLTERNTRSGGGNWSGWHVVPDP